MNDNDKQALLDGTASIQTKLIFHSDNIFDVDKPGYVTGNITSQGVINPTTLTTFELLPTGFKIGHAYAWRGYISSNYYLDTDKQYQLSLNADKNTFFIGMYAYGENDVYLGETSLLNNTSDRQKIFTVPNNALYVKFAFECRIANDIITFTDIVIEELPMVLTEENSVISWDHEDFRYVKDQGWIGQFVARQVTGKLKNISDDFNITDREFELNLGVKVENNTNWYSLGNFLITKITDDEVKDITSFEALDYTKKFNKIYEDTIAYPCTALELAQNVCNQCGVTLASTTFLNNDYVIEGNVFTNNETCRDVMKAIGKLAFSWVRVDWDNKVYIDFEKLNDIDEYDIIDNSKYYNLKTQKENFGGVNRIVIGYSQIEGERTKIENLEDIEENGVCELTVYDNPLVYTQEQRESIINSANGLFGLYYAPLNMLTVGHPWLNGKNLIQAVDMENKTYNAIPFNRTIQYFGHIKTLIDVPTATKTDTKYAYDANVSKNVKTITEIQVNKIEKQITEIVEETIDTGNPDSLVTKLSQSIRDIDSLKNIFQITGGSNLIKNSQFLFLDEVWEFNIPTLEYDLVYQDENQINYDLDYEGDSVDYGISIDPSNTYHTQLGEGYDSSLIGITTANAKIQLKNVSINTTQNNIDNLIVGKTYTLNYLYKQDSLTNSIVRLINNLDNSIVFEKNYNNEVSNMSNEEIQFVATFNSYTLQIETTTVSGQNGYFYIYDLMLNSGDKRNWEPAANEIYSTILKMSQLGLQVVATGSNIITLLTAQGFQIRKYNNGSIGVIITEFTDTGLTTNVAKTIETHIGDYIMKTLIIGNRKHHVEYFGGE